MVTIDGEGVDWTGHAEDDTKDYALIAFNSSNSGSNTKMSAKDKSGLGYGSQIHDRVLSYENEVFASFFDSSSSEETLETIHKQVTNVPKAVIKPKVWFDALIIEEYESDSVDKHVTIPSKEQEKPSFL
nr:hypothetical protein [Tanacetum cinerariifolium]